MKKKKLKYWEENFHIRDLSFQFSTSIKHIDRKFNVSWTVKQPHNNGFEDKICVENDQHCWFIQDTTDSYNYFKLNVNKEQDLCFDLLDIAAKDFKRFVKGQKWKIYDDDDYSINDPDVWEDVRPLGSGGR